MGIINQNFIAYPILEKMKNERAGIKKTRYILIAYDFTHGIEPCG
jgi:hypothetical protein